MDRSGLAMVTKDLWIGNYLLKMLDEIKKLYP